MLWVKAFHIITMVAWFAGLFYLPRLFVYHSMSTDLPSLERFKTMERKLYYGIMAPAGLLTIILGFILVQLNIHHYPHLGWLHLKIGLVFILGLFHLYCGKICQDFKYNRNRHSTLFYRCFNEIPTILLIAIVLLTILQPF